MALTNWTVRRMRAEAAVAASLALLVAVITFLLAIVAGYSGRAETVGVRDYLRTADPSAASLQVQIRRAPDPDKQLAAVTNVLRSALGTLPFTVYRSVTLPPAPVRAGAGPAAPAGPAEPGSKPEAGAEPSTTTIRVAVFEDLADHAHLVSGSWPDATGTAPGPGDAPGATQGALQQSAADALRVAVGDVITVGGTQPVTVRAIWTPNEPEDPYFAADAAAANGAAALAADRSSLGFLAVASTDVPKDRTAFLNVTIVPALAALRPADLPGMSHAVSGVLDAVVAARTAAPSGAVASGSLATTLDTVRASVTAAAAAGAIPGLVIAAIGAVMTIQLARLLAWQRRSETALIRSRGASVGQLARIALGEAGALALPAAAVGVLGAGAASAAAGIALPMLGWAVAPLVALPAMAIIVVPQVNRARQPANRQLIDDSGRIRGAVTAGTVALVAVAAGASLWRFLRAGSAVVIGDDGSTHLDPIAAAAPALTLITMAMVAAALFGALTAAGEGLTLRRRALPAWLTSRQIARRAMVFGIVVMLVSIAFGSVGIAAAYAPTQVKAQQQTNVLRNGAPLRVELPRIDPMMASDYRTPLAARSAALSDLSRTLPILSRDVTLGDAAAHLSGVPLSDVGAVVPSVHGLFEPEALAPALMSARRGLPLPAGTTSLTLQVTLAAAWAMPGPVTSHSDGPPTQDSGGPGPAGQSAEFDVTVWIQDPAGGLSAVATGGLAAVPLAPVAPGTATDATLTVDLPNLAAGSDIVAVDLVAPILEHPAAVDFSVRDITAHGDADRRLDATDVAWTAAPQPVSTNSMTTQLLEYRLTAHGLGLTGTLPAGQITAARVTLDGSPTLPVGVNQALADALDLHTGDRLDIAVDGARQVSAEAVAISPRLPGEPDQPGILADLRSVEQALLRATANLPDVNQLWAAPSDPAAAARTVSTLRTIVPATATFQAADSRSVTALATPAARTLWIGAAGALLLATVGIASAIAGLARSRRGEAVVLASVGITARRQARWRRGELWFTVAAAWVLGAAVAVVGVFLVVPALAGSAVVGFGRGQPELHVPWGLAAVAVGIHVVLVAAMVIGHGARLRAVAARSTPSELVR